MAADIMVNVAGVGYKATNYCGTIQPDTAARKWEVLVYECTAYAGSPGSTRLVARGLETAEDAEAAIIKDMRARGCTLIAEAAEMEADMVRTQLRHSDKNTTSNEGNRECKI